MLNRIDCIILIDRFTPKVKSRGFYYETVTKIIRVLFYSKLFAQKFAKTFLPKYGVNCTQCHYTEWHHSSLMIINKQSLMSHRFFLKYYDYCNDAIKCSFWLTVPLQLSGCGSAASLICGLTRTQLEWGRRGLRCRGAGRWKHFTSALTQGDHFFASLQ